MASKYVDVSLSTGLNDGSSLANAWWSLIEVFLNTMAAGTVTAGDTINVRTHDGTTDITETMLANVTQVTPTARDTPTEFVFDDGTIWTSGGVFYLATSAYYLNAEKYINFLCDGSNHRFNIQNTGTAAPLRAFIFNTGLYSGLEVSQTTSGTSTKTTMNTYSTVVATDFKFSGEVYSAVNPPIYVADYSSVTLINPVFDFTLDDRLVVNIPLLYCASNDSKISVIGGKIVSGRDDIMLVNKPSSKGANVLFSGFDCTGLLLDYDGVYGALTTGDSYSLDILSGVDTYDAIYLRGNVIAEYRKANLQPTAAATLPDGLNTPWSYKVSAANTAKGQHSALPSVEKVFEQTTGVKTLTVEMLINDNLDATTMAGELYAAFMYLDDVTGKNIVQSTMVAGGAIPVSTAAWSATTYGANPYSKFKLEVVTTGQVRTNTKVYCQIMCGIKRTVSTDFFFIDPDLSIV